MRYLIGALAGLVWGLLAGLINSLITKKGMAKNSAAAMMLANMARTAVDVAALAAIFLLRRLLPFSYEMALAGTAIALSLFTIVFAFRMGRPDR